ncbi:unnamed protein product [Diplocarpon coronariae]
MASAPPPPHAHGPSGGSASKVTSGCQREAHFHTDAPDAAGGIDSKIARTQHDRARMGRDPTFEMAPSSSVAGGSVGKTASSLDGIDSAPSVARVKGSS